MTEMQWIKGLGLFGISFVLVFGAVVFANAQTEDAPASAASDQVGAVIGQIIGIVKSTTTTVFGKTEVFRTSTAAYFERKLSEAQVARMEKWAAAQNIEDGADLDKLLVAEPKPLMDQIQDSSGLFEGIKIQAYKMLAFVFNTAYAFYAILALIVFWILRKIYKRFRGY
jgi:hypothetical protein